MLEKKDTQNVQSTGAPGPELKTTLALSSDFPLFDGTDMRISTITLLNAVLEALKYSQMIYKYLKKCLDIFNKEASYERAPFLKYSDEDQR